MNNKSIACNLILMTQVYLSNTFTSSILSWFENNPNTVIRDLYLHAFDKTNGSHVMVYNSDDYGSLYLNDMREYWSRSFN